MEISDWLIKHYLKNVMFITGTAYAGKSTMVRMLADTYDLVHCGENYDCVPFDMLTPEKNPNLCYFRTMKDWQEFVNRPPEAYEKWIYANMWELAEFEIVYLMRIPAEKKVIVDTNIPLEILHEIADYNQVAVMLSPQSMSVDHFFDRDDADKVFIREQIMQAESPEATMKNFLAGMARVNSREHYDEYAGSGFFTVVREDVVRDTREETLKILARHFGLMQ